MSATAFQRRRRERIKTMREEAEKQLKQSDYSDKTVKELKALLDEKGIEYDPKSKKMDLLTLLEPNIETTVNQPDGLGEDPRRRSTRRSKR